MKYLPIVLITILLSLNTLFAQEEYESDERVACFNGDQEYHFNALYIDSNGDTITNEKMVLRPLGRPWFFQMRYQVAVKYIYHTDTAGYKNYVDIEEYFHNRNQKYLKKKKKLLISEDETTGASAKNGTLYMHPPRTNQYRILQYAAHPLVYTKGMTDSIFKYSRTLHFIGMGGKLMQEYTVKPTDDTTVNNSIVKAWKILATSGGDFNDYNESLNLDSTMEAIVTKEYGFIKMHYTFKNNIKIQFDLEEVKMLN